MKTIIIGAGPAGLNAAIHARKYDNEVIIIEKNEKAGKKLFITGKGRCNVTNNSTNEEFINNVVNNPRFLFSAINNFSSQNTIDFFNNHHCPLITERGNRVFPKSYHAYDITDTLVKECRHLGVQFNFNEEVKSVIKINDQFKILTNKKTYLADFLIIATGGLSYPLTGSTGDGYKFAKSLSHTIIDPLPALTGIKIKNEISNELLNLTLKNISLNVKDGKFKHAEFGELTFYKNYIDGPIAITTSSLINRHKVENVQLELDLKPALNIETLIKRISNDIDKNPTMTILELLKGLMHAKFISFFNEIAHLDLESKCLNFSKNSRIELANLLKHLPLSYCGLNGFERAVVTSGGISTKEISSKTMESKIIENLFFAGEVIDVDAFTGGFNIQIALSTGALAGDSIINKIKSI